MCICVNASEATNTHVYVGKGTVEGKDVHVLAYQCHAIVRDKSGKGAMLLPIPSNEELTPDNFIDTTEFPSFLKDISEATKRKTRSMKSLSFGMVSMGAMIVERGTTTYVSARNFAEAAAALGQVREDRRPEFSAEFIEGCSALYTDPIVIACWAGSVTMDPLLLWYVPSNEKTFRIPTMDAHDGKAPDLFAMVDTDHIVSVSAGKKNGSHIHYSEEIPDRVRGLLPTRSHGVALKGRFQNGDLFVEVKDSLEMAEPIIVRSVSEHVPPSVKGELNGWDP